MHRVHTEDRFAIHVYTMPRVDFCTVVDGKVLHPSDVFDWEKPRGRFRITAIKHFDYARLLQRKGFNMNLPIYFRFDCEEDTIIFTQEFEYLGAAKFKSSVYRLAS